MSAPDEARALQDGAAMQRRPSSVSRAPAFGCFSLLDALGTGVLAVRRDGTIHYANPWASRILRREVLRGTDIGEVLVSAEKLREERREATHDVRREVQVRAGDGALVSLGYTCNEFRDEATGETMSAVLFQDLGAILELRRQRDQLLQLAALGDALPTVLHELRNPLATVTTTLEVLVEETEGDLQKDLHAALVELRRMALTLEGVGGFARSALTQRNVAVDLAVTEACRLLSSFADRKQVHLESIGGSLPLLPLDRGVVSCALFNLVRNAIDACAAGDRVTVDARLDGEVFELVVRDTGCGMSAEVLSRCTELFFTKKEKGSGIGLALCKRIAEVSGGELLIDSRAGTGTEVRMRLPLPPPRTKRAPV